VELCPIKWSGFLRHCVHCVVSSSVVSWVNAVDIVHVKGGYTVAYYLSASDWCTLCCVGVTAGLPVLHWSCAAAAAADDDDDDDAVTTMSHCPSDCHTHTDCAACLSFGARCVWSVRLQQVRLTSRTFVGYCVVQSSSVD